MEQVTTKPTFARHPDTEALIRYLSTIRVYGSVPYQTLMDVTGRNISDLRKILNTARKELAEDRYFFLTERGQGLRRVDDREWLLSRGGESRRSIHRKARRANRDLAKVDASELETKDRLQLAMEQTILSMHEVLERPKAKDTIKMLCDAEGHRLQLKDAAQALREIL